MNTITPKQGIIFTVTRLLGAALLIASFAAGITLALAAPSGAPAAVGAVSGTNCTPSCDLYAIIGTMPAASLPGAPAAGIPVWGYSTSNASVTAPGGPTLIVNEGDPVAITLHNVNIPSTTTLMIASQPVVPDLTGVATGNSKTYTFAAGTLKAGTYLYEAGLTPDGPRQVAMGLYGALIVRPAGAPSQAYASSNTAFNDEAVLVLSEIDPAFNAAPATFDMTAYAPRYWLINGKVYPNTDLITTAASNNVLLRYVNAGLRHHSMGLLGLHQTIIAADGNRVTNTSKVVAETVPSGSTLDTIVAMPASIPANAKYALFDAAMHADNAGVLSTPANPNLANTPIAFGGMLTFLTAAGTSTPPGPVTSNVSLSPNPTSGPGGNAPGPVTLTAAITGAPDQAEYFVDTIGANGAGCQIGGSLTNVSVSIAVSGATAPCADLTTLASGSRTFYVHGHDANGWGAFASAVLTLDKTGPSIGNLALTPSATNGTVNVALQATASDVATGNQNVTAAEYFIDSQPASTVRGTAITVSPATAVSLNSTILAATVNALSQGNHTIAVRALDTLGNWGAFGTITLTVDKTGPATSGVSTTPNPTNGTFGVQVGTGGGFYQRIDATVTDPVAGGVNSNIVAAEYFVDTVGANGTGGAMFATSGAFNGKTVSVYGAAELFAIAALSSGPHTIYVHGKDAAGNWGPTATTSLVVDKTGPSVVSAAFTPNPSPSPANVTLNVTATDPVNGAAPGSNVVAAEWYTGADPGAGSGTAMTRLTLGATSTFNATVSIPVLPLGSTYTVSIRAKDAANNWGPVVTQSLTVGPLFANGFESGNFSAWSATGGTAGRISVTTGAAQAGTYKMQALISGGTSGYAQDNTPANEASYHARFYFNPNGLTTGTGNNPATIDVFDGLNTANTTIFQVQYRRSTNTGYQVRLGVARSGGTTFTNWYTINNAAWNAIEIGWQSGGTASASLYTGGVLRQTLTGLNTSAYTLDTVRLGPQGTLPSGSPLGTLLFDSFVSTRNTLVIGP